MQLNRLNLIDLQQLARRLNPDGVRSMTNAAYRDRAAVVYLIIAAIHPRNQICYPADVPAATQESFL